MLLHTIPPVSLASLTPIAQSLANFFSCFDHKFFCNTLSLFTEPAIIVSKPSAPLLSEGSRLSISCAAYGYPLPTITWSSDALGVTDFAAVEGNDNSIRIYNTTYEDNTGNVFVISILELCDGDPMYLTDITCSADNELNLVSDLAIVSTIPPGLSNYLLFMFVFALNIRIS